VEFLPCPTADPRPALALKRAGLAVELRRNGEPPGQARPSFWRCHRGTVPVLEGRSEQRPAVWVIEESLEVMHWAAGPVRSPGLLRRRRARVARREATNWCDQ